MANLKTSLEDQGLEFSKILSLRRAGRLTEENINRYLKSEEAKEVARALMRQQKSVLDQKNVSQQSLYKAIDNLA